MQGAITPGGNIQWKIFRRGAHGRLLACVLVIEKSTSIVVVERCDPDVEDAATAPDPAPVATAPGVMGHLQKFGIPYKVKAGEDGRPVLEVQPHNAPKKTKRIMRFFDLTTPCDFPQCEELRKQWLQEKEQLGADPNCPTSTCAEGNLQRRYMELLNTLL